MASLKNVTRDSILSAIAEYDQLGADAFHAKHGTAPSAKYVLRHDGKDYPSKAIIAAAGGVSPKDFSGGPARLEGIIERCGFKLGQMAFGFAAALTTLTATATATAHAEQAPVSVAGPAVYFASGSSRPADIRGFSAIGQAIGVAAPELSPKAEDELFALAGSGVPVFVDSGAFSEVEFGPTGPAIARPITPAEWTKRLNLYARLAAVYAEAGAAHDLYLVAPDMVGFQDATLERLTTYRSEVLALIGQGVNVLVVSQKGRLSQADFDARVEAVLGSSSYVRALPCNKGATTAAEIAAFCTARRPTKLHLLGMGPKSRGVEKALEAVKASSPETVVYLDSNLITSAVGRSNGPGGAPRLLTAARDAAKALIEAGRSAIKDVQELGIILAWGRGFQLSLV